MARNETLFREINERISAIGERLGLESLDIVCECVSDDCTQALTLRHTDYERLRSSGNHFAIVPGHEQPDLERVTEKRGGYDVVEKLGVSAEVAEELDPR